MSHIIGIDVSKATLDCAWLRDPDQDKAKRKSCQNEVDCFESLITWSEVVSKLHRRSLAFVVEPTHVYHEQLVQFLHSKGATVYLVNPGRVRKFAEGIGILSKNDVIDADLPVRYGLMARKLIAYEPAPQEVNDLRSLLNRLDVLEKNLRRELNRLEKAGRVHYRQALYFPAMVASRKNPDVQALYERLVEAGKPKMCALGAAMRKLVHICYGVYRNPQPYRAQVPLP